jgi:hypothetical protein
VLSSVDCLATAAELSLGANYASAHSRILAEMTGTSLHHPEARVTIGLRIHQGTDVSKLDDAVASLANQTYRKFKVKLLVDGPWSFAEPLAARYGLPLICTGMSTVRPSRSATRSITSRSTTTTSFCRPTSSGPST